MLSAKEEAILVSVKSKKRSAQEIKNVIAEALDIKLKPGNLYPSLKKLSSENLIKKEWKNRESFYEITEEGKKYLKRKEEQLYQLELL